MGGRMPMSGPGATTRRRVLAGIGSVLGLGSLRSSPVGDRDDDGIGDRRERGRLEDRLEDIFGAEQVDPLDPDRPDLIIDARYVGTAGVSAGTKQEIADRFHDQGIALQWLDYPHRYDRDRFEEHYGDRVERILWPFGSFYAREIEAALRDVALQLVVLPSGLVDLRSFSTVYQGEDYEGVSFGNRSLVTEQSDTRDELVLVMHEIGHLVLCHSDDEESVMFPTPSSASFTDDEWRRLRADLENVHDATGFDVAFRGCLLGEYRDAFEGMVP